MQQYDAYNHIDKDKIRPKKVAFFVPVLFAIISVFIFVWAIGTLFEISSSYSSIGSNVDYIITAEAGESYMILGDNNQYTHYSLTVDNNTIDVSIGVIENSISIDKIEGYTIVKTPDNTTISYNESLVLATINFYEAGTYTVSTDADFGVYAVSKGSGGELVRSILLMILSIFIGGAGFIGSIIVISLKRSSSKNKLIAEISNHNTYQEPQDFTYDDF